MSVLTEFQVNAARNDLYRSRLDALSVQATQEAAMAEALAGKEQERVAKEQERAAKEEALARVERLRERLRAAGMDPDA